MASIVVAENHEEFEGTRPDNDESSSNDHKEKQESVHCNGNPGWADAMAKILGKQLPEDKPAILIKYKKAEREKKRKQEEHAKQKLLAQEKHAAREKNHVKPSVAINDENERVLRRIATRGVVKLFNAVNKHQKELESKLKSAPTEAKKAKVLKSVSKTSFLDMLKNNSNDAMAAVNDVDMKDDKLSKWSILREDFMMGGKMKDWDKDEDDLEYENEDNGEVEESASEESE